MKAIEELKKELGNENIKFGTDLALKRIRNGKITKVFIASNCPNEIRDEIKHYSKLGKIEVFELDETNEEIGFICKKTFSIDIVSV